MADPVITNVDTGQIAIDQCAWEHHNINFAGADVLAAGTILARHSTNGKFQIYAKGGVTNENGIPKGVLAASLVATGAGDLGCSVIVAGVVNRDRLIIDADGTGANIDGSVVDDLADYGITAKSVKQLAQQDNQ